MSDDTKVWKALAKFVDYETIKVGKGDKFVIRYTAPNYKDPEKVIERGDWDETITQELVDKATSLTLGELFCVVTSKNDAGYDVLVDILDAKEAPQKKESSWKGKSNSGGGYNNVGNAVGGAWKDVIALLPLAGVKISLQDEKAEDAVIEMLNRLTWKIELIKWEQEKKLKEIMYPKGKDDKPAEEKLTKAEIAKRKKEANATAAQPKQTKADKAKAKKEEPPVDQFEGDDLDDADLTDDDEPDVE